MQNQSTNKLLIHISHKILSISNCSFQRYAGVVSDSHSKKNNPQPETEEKSCSCGQRPEVSREKRESVQMLQLFHGIH